MTNCQSLWVLKHPRFSRLWLLGIITKGSNNKENSVQVRPLKRHPIPTDAARDKNAGLDQILQKGNFVPTLREMVYPYKA